MVPSVLVIKPLIFIIFLPLVKEENSRRYLFPYILIINNSVLILDDAEVKI